MRKAVLATLLLQFFANSTAAEYVGGLDPAGDNYLSLRKGPGSKYEEIRQLPPGTFLTIVERRAAWRKVRLEGGAEGWVFGKYIKYGPPQTAESASEPTPDEFPPDEDIDSEGRGDTLMGDDVSAPAGDASALDIDGIMQDIAKGIDGEN